MINGNSVPSILTAASDGYFYGSLADASGFGNAGGAFRISAGGAFKLLFGFDGASEVHYPNNPIILATNGKLYGTTSSPSGTGNGTIYDSTTGGVVTDLFNFTATANLQGDSNNLLQASNGNFYGASRGGGAGNMGGLFELTPPMPSPRSFLRMRPRLARSPVPP